MSTKYGRYTVVFLLIVSAIMFFWGINFGLPQTLHSDEQVILKRALRFGSGDLNPHFFYYPPLMMYLLFLAYGVYYVLYFMIGVFNSPIDMAYAYIRDPSMFYLIGRGISAIFGIGCVLTTYFIGKKFYKSNAVGIVGALLLLAVPDFVSIGHYIKPDTGMLFCTLCFFYVYLVALEKKNNILYFFLCGLLLGFAAAFKYYTAVSIVIVPVGLLLGVRKDFKFVLRDGLLIPGIGLLVGFTIVNPYWILDFGTFIRHIRDLASFTAYDTVYGKESGWLNYLKIFLFLGKERIYLGVLLICGVVFSFLEIKKHLLLLILVFIIYILCSLQRIQQWQYILPAVPFASLMCGYWIEKIGKLTDKKGVVSVGKILYLLVGILIMDGILISAIYNYYRAGKDTRQYALEWIEENIPEGSKILLDVNGPQIKRSKAMIRKQYEMAFKMGHYKKDYFELQLNAQQGKEYNFNYIDRKAIAPPEMVSQSRGVEFFEPLRLDRNYIEKKGYEYIIISPYGPEHSEEEEWLDANYILLKEFIPRKYIPTLPFRVKIYKVK